MTAFSARAAASLALGVLFSFTALDTIPARAQTTPSPDLRDDQFAVAYQINPAHSGGITLDQSFAPPLRVLWNDTTEGAMSYPLIARGKVFIWVSHFTDLNQNAGVLYAVDKTNGYVVWQADLAADQGYAGIAYDEGRVFVLTLDGILTALDADSGVQQWSVQPRTGAVAPPIAANGRVFLSGANTSGIPETLFAIDETSGNTLWSQALSVDLIPGTMMLGALSDQGVFAADVCSVQGFNPVTGTPLFLPSSTGVGGGCDNASWVAAYYRGFLYTQNFGPSYIFDVNAEGFAGFFGADTGQDIQMVPAFQGSAGYLASEIAPNWNGVFTAFDFRTGTTLWRVAAPYFGNFMSPIVVNDTVYFLDYAGTLHAFDRVSGAEVWNGNGGPLQETKFRPLTGMAAGEGVLIVPIGRHLYALVPASGN